MGVPLVEKRGGDPDHEVKTEGGRGQGVGIVTGRGQGQDHVREEKGNVRHVTRIVGHVNVIHSRGVTVRSQMMKGGQSQGTSMTKTRLRPNWRWKCSKDEKELRNGELRKRKKRWRQMIQIKKLK